MSSDVVAGNVYDKYGTKNPIARWLMARFLADLRRLYDARPDETVVEIGCGEGELLARLRSWCPARRVVGLDLSGAILRQARAHGLAVAAQSAERLALRDGAADVVVASEVLEHLANPLAALQEIARVARRRVILSVPREPVWRALNCARLRYLGDLGNTPGHVQHFSRDQFVALVSRCFRVVEVRTPLPWTLVSAEPV
jgi:ubiquinone/menaquinone biosynthesis C-methylase UbiE